MKIQQQVNPNMVNTKFDFITEQKLVLTNTLAGTPSEKLEWKYSELSNFHKIWNVIHDSKYQIKEKLGSKMFR